jgi:hypothetical protein
MILTHAGRFLLPALEERYEASKKEIGARTETNEKLLFHGTSNEAIDKIIMEGFKVGGQEVVIRTGFRKCSYLVLVAFLELEQPAENHLEKQWHSEHYDIYHYI